MMASPSTSQHREPSEGLESLDDLIRQQQEQRRRTSRGSGRKASDGRSQRDSNRLEIDDELGRSSSSIDTIVAPPTRSGGLEVEIGGSGGGGGGNQSGDSSMTIKAASIEAGSPPTHGNGSPLSARIEQRDESRWNGFHLWRAESYQRRVSSQQQARDEQMDAQAQDWPRRLLKAAARRTRQWFVTTFVADGEQPDGSPGMSTLKMIALTIVQGGVQVAWCLEFGYGTPYLLSLGLSKSSTSLVWLAAPVSGLVVQPLVGVLSDRSSSRYRRRRFIALSTVSFVLSTLILAFSFPIASALVDVLHAGLADWDPQRVKARDDINSFLAIVGFICLDLSINAVQIAARALVLDTTPTSLHLHANAWGGRMNNAGSVFGYAAGWYDLSSAKWLKWLGGGQFRKYAIVSLLAVLVCSTITCTFIDEAHTSDDLEGQLDEAGGPSSDQFTSAATGGVSTSILSTSRPSNSSVPPLSDRVRELFAHIWQATRRLPRPIRRICLVQFFAWMGWFPFLFYATQWVIEVWSSQQKHHRDMDDSVAELGSFALLMFAIVSFISGSLLPYAALANARPEQPVQLDGPENQLHDSSSRENGDSSNLRRNTSTKPRVSRWRLSMRTIWTISLVIYAAQTLIATFIAKTSRAAIAVIASIGVPWSVAIWVPYVLVMESVREAEDGVSPYEFEADWFAPERVRSRRERASFSAAEEARKVHAARALRDCEPLGKRTGNGNGNGNGIATSRRSGSTGSITRSISGQSSLSGSQRRKHSPLNTILARGGEVVGGGGSGSGEGTVGGQQASQRAVSGSGVPVPTAQGAASKDGESAGATILGIHNISLVIPQLVVAVIAALILKNRDGGGGLPILVLRGATRFSAQESEDVSVVWVLRFGGLAAIVGAILTRFVPLSRTERRLRGDHTSGLREYSETPRYDDEVSDDDGEDGEQDEEEGEDGISRQ